MRDRQPPERDAEVLPERTAERLLTRASELDAVRDAQTSVASLRAAAAEAGISTQAFDAALTELREEAQTPVPIETGQVRGRGRMWAFAATVALLLLGAAFTVARTFPGTAAVTAAPIVEEAFLLRCLQPGHAAELIRPLLRDPTSTVVHSPAQAPRVITVRATPAQMQVVRSVLDRYEGPGSPAPACATGSTPRAVTP